MHIYEFRDKFSKKKETFAKAGEAKSLKYTLLGVRP